MAEKADLFLILGLDTTEYTSNIKKATRQARNIQRAFDDVVGAANEAEKALKSITGGKATIEVDDSALRALSGSREVDIVVDDSAVVAAKRKLDDLDVVEEAKVNVDDSSAAEALQSIRDGISDIRNLAVIDVIFNFAGDALDPNNIPFLGTIVETDNAVRQLNARVGRDVPEAGDIIREVYTGAFGESREEVALAAAEVLQLGVSADQAANVTAKAMTVAEVSGQDFTEVLQAADALVKNNIAPDFDAAFDLIVAGIQGGLDRNGDLLDSFKEYAPIFADLGIRGRNFCLSSSRGCKPGRKTQIKLLIHIKSWDCGCETGSPNP